MGQKLEFLEKFWSFREFLEWFERSGVVWSILNDFIILEFSENFWRGLEKQRYTYRYLGCTGLNMVVITVIL